MTEETAVVIREEVKLGVLPADGPTGIITRATSIATQLARIVNDRKLFTPIRGKKYVRVEGWSTLGAMMGVLPREVATKRLEDGGYEAAVELVRVSDGAIIGRGSAICGMDEDRWGSAEEYARRSMAITRATGKAFRLGFSWIMALAGYEATPAEEIVDGEVVRPQRQQRQPQRAQHAKNGVRRPLSAEALIEFLRRKVKDDNGEPATEKQAPFVARKFEEAFAPAGDAEKRYHLALHQIWGVTSAKDLTKAQAKATLDWLLDKSGPDDTGDTPLHPAAAAEAASVWRLALVERGQGEMELPEEGGE